MFTGRQRRARPGRATPIDTRPCLHKSLVGLVPLPHTTGGTHRANRRAPCLRATPSASYLHADWIRNKSGNIVVLEPRGGQLLYFFVHLRVFHVFLCIFLVFLACISVYFYVFSGISQCFLSISVYACFSSWPPLGWNLTA